ncbi:MAG: hypothetical protein LN573_03005 [Rickettsia endosymbiont of Oxypoda opaca]|nr:hypothetical protein [Rickettsia endosymbiont of Oxypoda opaca]
MDIPTSLRVTEGIVAWIEFSMSFPRKRESRKYLSELYSKFLYNFAYFKCFFLDSRLRGNDIHHFFRAMQQRPQQLGIS